MTDTRTHFIVLVPNYWGKGETRKEALANLKKSSHRTYKKDQQIWYKVHPETRIDEMGRFRYPVKDDSDIMNNQPYQVDHKDNKIED